MTADAIKKLEVSDFKFHKMSSDQVLKHFNSDSTKGLTSNEAELRLKKHGANKLDEEVEDSLWEKIKEAFDDLLAKILLLAAFISFVIALISDGDEGLAAYVEPFVIILILVLNAGVAIYQDMDAESALDALKNMQPATCQALRDGKW